MPLCNLKPSLLLVFCLTLTPEHIEWNPTDHSYCFAYMESEFSFFFVFRVQCRLYVCVLSLPDSAFYLLSSILIDLFATETCSQQYSALTRFMAENRGQWLRKEEAKRRKKRAEKQTNKADWTSSNKPICTLDLFTFICSICFASLFHFLFPALLWVLSWPFLGRTFFCFSPFSSICSS